MKSLKILHIAAEVTPFSSVGGLSSVVSYLSKSLSKKGHDVRIFMPKFGTMDEGHYKLETIFKGLKVPTGYKKEDNKPLYLICNVKKFSSDAKVTVYFLENMEYYEKRSNVYAYSDDHVRWALLSYGALKYIADFSHWVPDVIHVHDWHTALVPNMIASDYGNNSVYNKVATVLTIHNLHFQGQSIDHNSEMNFDDGRSQIPRIFSPRLAKLNFLKRGIMYSDLVNTVSKGYARQILTSEYGEGLDRLLQEVRSKVFGIINGIDYEKMNPAVDSGLAYEFDADNLDKRKKNKLYLQKEFNLIEDENIPVFGYVGRLDAQKGIDLMLEVLDKFLRDFKAQFVLVGSGSHDLEKKANDLAKKYKGYVGAHTYANFSLPKAIFGGADIMLMPSRFEPCGIVQMESMRYGAIPIVRATGGLDDTVEDFNPSTLKGTGFKFKEFDGWSLYGQMVRAIETLRNSKNWKVLQKNAMSADFSWDTVSAEYENLYLKALQIKNELRNIKIRVE